MDLSIYASAHVDYMFEEITKKLRMATGGSFKGMQIKEADYDDLKDLYELVISKDKFSILEIDAITTELGRFRQG
jgi:uncharacterized protein YfkK (UPF0435 family)